MVLSFSVPASRLITSECLGSASYVIPWRESISRFGSALSPPWPGRRPLPPWSSSSRASSSSPCTTTLTRSRSRERALSLLGECHTSHAIVLVRFSMLLSRWPQLRSGLLQHLARCWMVFLVYSTLLQRTILWEPPYNLCFDHSIRRSDDLLVTLHSQPHPYSVVELRIYFRPTLARVL